MDAHSRTRVIIAPPVGIIKCKPSNDDAIDHVYNAERDLGIFFFIAVIFCNRSASIIGNSEDGSELHSFQLLSWSRLSTDNTVHGAQHGMVDLYWSPSTVPKRQVEPSSLINWLKERTRRIKAPTAKREPIAVPKERVRIFLTGRTIRPKMFRSCFV
eukprot:scaffold8800_cov107-Cylindrotheca_fusiformis.AAC.6